MVLNPALIKSVVSQFKLETYGHHGPSHWMRVRKNGLDLACETGANTTVVELFSLFHDSCRESEWIDYGHGTRGAELAFEYYQQGLLDCSQFEIDLLLEACAGHTDGTECVDATIATCWDADRLDLWRVGITPDLNRLFTQAAKQKNMIGLCMGRSQVWRDRYFKRRSG
jgi:uncharacterized protein